MTTPKQFNCYRCNHRNSPIKGEFCDICKIAADRNPFPYKGTYLPDIDEYDPNCKNCSGEGWHGGRNPISGDYLILSCSCNPEKLGPRPWEPWKEKDYGKVIPTHRFWNETCVLSLGCFPTTARGKAQSDQQAYQNVARRAKLIPQTKIPTKTLTSSSAPSSKASPLYWSTTTPGVSWGYCSLVMTGQVFRRCKINQKFSASGPVDDHQGRNQK